MNIEQPRYKNPTLQAKWEDAVSWLRTKSKRGWVLDKEQFRQQPATYQEIDKISYMNKYS